VITGFFGIALLPIDICSFKLFPYRIFFILLLPLFFIRILFNEKLSLFNSGIKWYLIFLIFWLGYSFISLTWAISKANAIKDIVFLFMGIALIFFICLYIRNKKDFMNIYYLCFVAFICLILIGFWEVITGNHLLTSRFFDSPLRFIPTSTFHNQNDFATFLALYIPFGIGIFYYAHSLVLRFLGIMSISGAVYLILVTKCVSGILAVVLELIVLSVLYIFNKRKFFLLAVLIPVVGIIVVWQYPFIHQYIQQMASVGERINLIRNGIHFLCCTFGFGVGAGNIEYWMVNYPMYDVKVLNIHNWWAEILAEYGIFVFAGYVLFYFDIIYQLIKTYLSTTSCFMKLLCTTLILSLCGFFVACIGPSSFLNITAQWYIFGIALAFLKHITSTEEQNG
ncbi:MAG TPA: O-antigen ligase family protein, partial [Spirochaetota bacterium]|nr:O-antigen ligase family protein [Spirochaetota bacterium]